MPKRSKPEIPEPNARLVGVLTRLSLSGRSANLADVITAAKQEGHSVSWDDLSGFHVLLTPPFVIHFLRGYVSEKAPKSMLDPFAGVGSLLLPLAIDLKPSVATGIVRSDHEESVARAMDDGSATKWLKGSLDALLDTSGTFDLIVSSPALGLHPVSAKFKTKDGEIEVRDSQTYIDALKATLHLTETGEAIFIFPNGFFFSDRSTSLREALPKIGLFVNAVIALPAGAFTHTSIELNLVIISRHPTPDLFVGRLSPEQEPATLLANMKKRRAGPAPELGRLVPHGAYRGWHALVAVEEEQRLVERSGLERVLLRDLVEAVNLGKQTEDGGFEALPNCVYLPLIGTSPAVTSLSDLRIKPQNYAQLVTCGDKVYAEFLAGFFNSPLGRKTRESMLSGTFIPKLTKQTILQATVYVLPLEAQKRATDAGREIQELQLRLEQLHRDLWHRPGDADKVRKSVSALNQKEGFESWLETLPFPLASILWRYQAASNAEHKVIHLLNYFEAAVQFFGTLMASAFHSNQTFFTEHRRDWFESGKDNPHSLAKSTFGEWVVRCLRLAKTTRQLLSDKEHKNFCLDMYRTTDSVKPEAIANKGIYAVLETVGRYRNDWKGHTGIVSAKEHARRLSLLQEELTRLRGLLGGAFEDWVLIRPGKSAYTGGVYHYSIERIMGSRQIFKEEELNTTEVMDSAELYFIDAATRRPLQLLPFVRMMPSPETEEAACYFYNRLEKSSVRWVSYHFESQAERMEPDPSLLRIIAEVEQNGGD